MNYTCFGLGEATAEGPWSGRYKPPGASASEGSEARIFAAKIFCRKFSCCSGFLGCKFFGTRDLGCPRCAGGPRSRHDRANVRTSGHLGLDARGHLMSGQLKTWALGPAARGYALWHMPTDFVVLAKRLPKVPHNVKSNRASAPGNWYNKAYPQESGKSTREEEPNRPTNRAGKLYSVLVVSGSGSRT